MLELYTTLSRSEVQEDEHILEESVDGMDFVAGVLFADAEGKSGTNVTLRLGYYLPGELQLVASTACFLLACKSGGKDVREGGGGGGKWCTRLKCILVVRCCHCLA